MTEETRIFLASRPTADQMQRFAALSVEERFHWLVDMLALCYELAPPEARARWREHKAAGTMP